MFKAALEATAQRGFEVPDFAPTDNAVLENAMSEVREALSSWQFVEPTSLSSFARQCGQRTMDFAQLLREHAPMLKSYVTVGVVHHEGKPLWTMNIDDLPTARATGSYHIWLTLSSHEIIDVTVTSTLMMQGLLPANGIKFFLGDPNEEHRLTWIPLLVGDGPALRLL
ncbi:hypothetical protein WL60_11100 [Burkholderia ubonensis]|nr:hypothetical protein WK46_06115 [Burkholderia ubonensis]KWD09206.1 hypothetical protein WL59_04960 [Burkholderia ubonensis]KWD16346.1 hypothetical protein WL60_11100 [Burkholderia ubonensis]